MRSAPFTTSDQHGSARSNLITDAMPTTPIIKKDHTDRIEGGWEYDEKQTLKRIRTSIDEPHLFQAKLEIASYHDHNHGFTIY